MAKIFLSYRREDSEYPAHQIYRELSDHLGAESVVFDVDTIPLGTDFRAYIKKQVSECDILLAVIGDKWLEILKQRLDEQNDYVRIEIQAALERDIPVVPILVGKASVPNEKNLPTELAGLAYRNAAEVRAGPDLKTHLHRLIHGLDHLLSERITEKEQRNEGISKTFTNSIGMEFVLISAGRFRMGSGIRPEEVVRRYGGEVKWFKREHPQHNVKIRYPFYMQTTEVTVGQWRRFIHDCKYLTEAEINGEAYSWDGSAWVSEKGINWDKPGFSKNESHPVTCVTWKDVQIFISWLNDTETDSNYRLPTEAEWEYAGRAGSSTEFFFGTKTIDLADYAWYSDNSQRRTHAVGGKKPNKLGLYDMSGNVWEWMEDDWHDSYNDAPDDGTSWNDNPRSTYRVRRGGGWGSGGSDCRSTMRGISMTDFCSNGIGFRLVKSQASR